MEYLLDNPRILFTVLLVTIYVCLVLLMALVYRIAGRIETARAAARLRSTAAKQAYPQTSGLQTDCGCRPGSAPPLGACCSN